ncbi:MAG: class I SAM-dependent methyltransferase, partial [Elusimicrobia bacterium]|nr:class I SAM-dependent methyltransferase [Elusimicrobiota bacterium]
PYCVEKCGLPEVRVGSITQTGLPDASFDAVLAHNVFHHIPDYGAALQELFRILRPKGLLCFIEPRNSTWRRVMDYLTFSTPLPRWVPSVRLRYEVMEQERATGLYPQWLRSQKKFFSLLEKGFQVLWLKKEFLFLVGKAEKREGASLCSPS